MLQRIQSLWLLFATAFTAVTFRFPFFSGVRPAPVNNTAANANTFNAATGLTDLNATTTIWLTIVTVLTALLALVTIFLYGDRKLQLKLTYLGIFLTVALLVMYFLEMANFSEGTVALWSVFYVAILVCYILAARGIWRDQKLIKSLDRFR